MQSMIVFFFSRLKSPLPTHKSSSASACLSSGGTGDIEEAKKLHIPSSPFPSRFKEGKRVVRSETLLIGMGKRLTPPSRLISELQCLSRRICCTRSPLRRRESTRWDFRHFIRILISVWAVFRIRYILVRGSVSLPLSNGSGTGSCSFRQWPSRCL